jgi:hypothetical protein
LNLALLVASLRIKRISFHIATVQSAVKIKDLPGTNKVAGEGMLEWKVVDKIGRECTITIKGYHVQRLRCD